DIHYKLALLYDDKMNDPLSALHHFRRYLTLSPNGSHAGDVKNSMKRDEVAVLTTLSGDSVVTRAEAARLRNENLDLHKELEGRPDLDYPVVLSLSKASRDFVRSTRPANRHCSVGLPGSLGTNIYGYILIPINSRCQGTSRVVAQV